MATLLPSFFIVTLLLQVTRTAIKSQMSSILDWMVHFTLELLALEK